MEEKQNIVGQLKERASLGFDHYKQFILSRLTIRSDTEAISNLILQFDQTSESIYFTILDAYLTEDFNEDLQHTHPPTLILAGEQDQLFPISIYGITAIFIGAKLCIIPYASTLVSFDNPTSTAHAIHTFIHEQETGHHSQPLFQISQSVLTKALYKGFKNSLLQPTLTVNLLNTFQVEIGEVNIIRGWNLRKAKSLFLYLLFHRTATREKLIDVFWHELEIDKAQNSLRVSLNHLKSLLHQLDGIKFLHTDRGHVVLQGNIQCDALTDLHQMEVLYI